MANDHPFQMLFETLGRLPIAHAEAVNRQAYEILYDILSVPVEKTGRCILLRAPRAGHGKTHLLSRIQHHLGGSHEFIPLHASFGCQIDATSVIDDSLRRLLRPLPASGGLCVLDLVARRLFSLALQPLVSSGEVPCQDREGALTALRTRPIETFDFHHPNAVTAHWARENFEVLGQRLSMELSQRCDLPVREVGFWVDALFRFAATPVENPMRVRVLADTVHGGDPGEGVLMERLEALLGMLALLMRVVLVADDLEGFSADETAALRLAAFLGGLRQSVERLDVILSLNQDIWQSAFVPRLSGGLADRLSEVVIELEPLTEDEMVALLESRVPGLGERVMARVDLKSAGSHARGLVRAAGVAWLRASAMDSQQNTRPAPVVAPAVIPPGLLHEPPVATFVEPTLPQNPPEQAPVVPSPVPVSEEIPPHQPAAAVSAPVVAPAVERAPDPTLAIKFLRESANESAHSDEWPAAESSFGQQAPPAPADSVEFVDSPFQGSASIPEAQPPPATSVPCQLEPAAPDFPPQQTWPVAENMPTAESAPWIAPVESPFQPTFAPAELAANLEPPANAFIPVDSPPPSPPLQGFGTAPEIAGNSIFQMTPESVPAPDFQAAPEFAASPGFQSAPQTASPPVENTPSPAVPDTDRVDELLRQFRERYGRGM